MKTMITNFRPVLLCIALALCLSAIHQINAQTVPALVNYQGRLANLDGTTLTTGDYTLTFRVYNSATNSGGLIWGPQVFDGVAGQGHGGMIPVVQGYFNVMLGPVDTNGVSLANAFNATNRFVEIRVGTNNPILPRQQILSAPFAFQAANSAKLAGYDWSVAFGTNSPGSGTILAQQIGIGTSPVERLSIQGVGTSGTIMTFRDSNEANRLRFDYNGSVTAVGTDGNTRFDLGAAGFSANSTIPNALSLTTNGNVGIRKENPATVLDVNGTVTATSFSGSGAGITGLNLTNMAARQVGTNVGVGGVAVSLPVGFQNIMGNSFQDVSNLAVTIQTTGRPVMAMVVPSLLNNASNTPTATAKSGLVFLPANTSSFLCLRLVRDEGVGAIATFVGSGSSSESVGYPSVIGTFIDLPSAGIHSYKLQSGTLGSGSPNAEIHNSVLVIFEL